MNGARSGFSLQLTTPTGFVYEGSFTGERLAGTFSGPGLHGRGSVTKQ